MLAPGVATAQYYSTYVQPRITAAQNSFRFQNFNQASYSAMPSYGGAQNAVRGVVNGVAPARQVVQYGAGLNYQAARGTVQAADGYMQMQYSNQYRGSYFPGWGGRR